METLIQGECACLHGDCGLNVGYQCQRDQGPCEKQGYPCKRHIQDALITITTIIVGGIVIVLAFALHDEMQERQKQPVEISQNQE